MEREGTGHNACHPQCHRGMWRTNERGRKGPLHVVCLFVLALVCLLTPLPISQLAVLGDRREWSSWWMHRVLTWPVGTCGVLTWLVGTHGVLTWPVGTCRMLTWPLSTWWHCCCGLCGPGPHPPAKVRDVAKSMWWIFRVLTWPLSTWPCQRGCCQHGRVNVAMSTWPLSRWFVSRWPLSRWPCQGGHCRCGHVNVAVVDVAVVDMAVSTWLLSMWPCRRRHVAHAVVWPRPTSPSQGEGRGPVDVVDIVIVRGFKTRRGQG